MDNFFMKVGMFSIAFIIVYGYKKILGYFDLKYPVIYESEAVYQAADDSGYEEFIRSVNQALGIDLYSRHAGGVGTGRAGFY
ncbi:hypothetical protein AALB39_11635 [Lachnospiraceae bacterium 54-53]